MSILFDLSDKYLTSKDYESSDNPDIELNLDDIMVCYSDGKNVKVIPLDVMKCYPLLYDVNENNKILSLVVCPFTLAACVYEGKCKLTQHIEKSCLMIELEGDVFNLIDNPFNFRRHQVIYKPLRQVFKDNIHAEYLKLIKKSPGRQLVDQVTKDYYESDKLLYDDVTESVINNKLLVYVINYTSSKTQTVKHTILVGRHYTDKKYDTGIYDYLEKNEEKINEKLGFIMPMLWFATRLFYKDAKILLLD
jgi:hypothetical protein